MNEQRGVIVDAETQKAIQDSSDKIIEAIKKDFDDLKDYIREHTAGKTKPIEENVTRLRTDIADLYNKDRDRIIKDSEIEQRLSLLEGNRTGRDTADERSNQRAEVNNGRVFGIIGSIAGAGGLIFGLFQLLKG